MRRLTLNNTLKLSGELNSSLVSVGPDNEPLLLEPRSFVCRIFFAHQGVKTGFKRWDLFFRIRVEDSRKRSSDLFF